MSGYTTTSPKIGFYFFKAVVWHQCVPFFLRYCRMTLYVSKTNVFMHSIHKTRGGEKSLSQKSLCTWRPSACQVSGQSNSKHWKCKVDTVWRWWIMDCWPGGSQVRPPWDGSFKIHTQAVLAALWNSRKQRECFFIISERISKELRTLPKGKVENFVSDWVLLIY